MPEDVEAVLVWALIKVMPEEGTEPVGVVEVDDVEVLPDAAVVVVVELVDVECARGS